MFYGLAIFLCLAVLFIVLTGASVVCAAGLWASTRLPGSFAPRVKANLLFALRVLPLLLAFLVTVGLALPAFLRFEPRASGEMIGLRLLGLAALGAAALAGIAVRALWMLRSTSRAQRQWRRSSQPLKTAGLQAPVYCTEGPAPLLAVTGIFRPRIFVARKVAENLSAPELSAAIAHEMAHVGALDNLKQFVLKIFQPPKWLNIFRQSDAAWRSASEMAADEGALARGASALELSSALVKVGRLSREASFGHMIAASYLLPALAESCIEVRVTHLQKLLESNGQPEAHPSDSRLYWIFSFLMLALAYLICLNAALPWMHEALEWLVR